MYIYIYIILVNGLEVWESNLGNNFQAFQFPDPPNSQLLRLFSF